MRYRFGPFVLDRESAELRRASEKLAVRPKCLDLLIYLLEHPRTLVTKETLLTEVWRDAIVVEATLARTMAELRSLLGDDPKNPRFIETVARRGYKFIVEPEKIRGGGEAQTEKASFVLIHQGKSYPLADGDHVIGRNIESDIPLPTILGSRQHARIRVAGNTVILDDLGSRNGTFVNEQKVKAPRHLRPGDKIRIGEELMLLWWSDSTKTAPGDWAVSC